MRFFIKHIIIYIVVFILFIASAVIGKILWNWYTFSFFIFLGIIWLIAYFPLVIWLTYKKIVKYITASREIILNQENREQNIKKLAIKIADEEFGLPEFITKRIVSKINVEEITKIIKQKYKSNKDII